MGFSYQKPERVARERDEAERGAWLEETWEEDLKRAVDGDWVFAFVDESGFSLTPAVRKTWAPEGETPELVHSHGRWRKVNAITAVTSDRRFYFRLKEHEAINSEDVRAFVEMLLRFIEEPLVVVWDNVAQHRARVVRALEEEHRRLRIEPLPAYSPDFNPDERLSGYSVSAAKSPLRWSRVMRRRGFRATRGRLAVGGRNKRTAS